MPASLSPSKPWLSLWRLRHHPGLSPRTVRSRGQASAAPCWPLQAKAPVHSFNFCPLPVIASRAAPGSLSIHRDTPLDTEPESAQDSPSLLPGGRAYPSNLLVLPSQEKRKVKTLPGSNICCYFRCQNTLHLGQGSRTRTHRKTNAVMAPAGPAGKRPRQPFHGDAVYRSSKLRVTLRTQHGRLRSGYRSSAGADSPEDGKAKAPPTAGWEDMGHGRRGPRAAPSTCTGVGERRFTVVSTSSMACPCLVIY